MNIKGFLEDLKLSMIKNGVYTICCTGFFGRNYEYDKRMDRMSYISLSNIDNLIEIYSSDEIQPNYVTLKKWVIRNINTCEKEIDTDLVPIESISHLEISEKHKVATVYFKDGKLMNNIFNYDEIIKKMKGGIK